MTIACGQATTPPETKTTMATAAMTTASMFFSAFSLW
jgi:hypothetical protein